MKMQMQQGQSHVKLISKCRKISQKLLEQTSRRPQNIHALIVNQVKDKENIENICPSIIAKLQANGVANSVISSVVGDVEELSSGMHSG